MKDVSKKAQLPSHVRGTRRGEDSRGEAGREGNAPTARSSTSICPEDREPIDPRMPHMPPA